MTERGLPFWRSMLYVPASNERFVSKAAERGADAIVLDLEDGVAPEHKSAARAALAGYVGMLAESTVDVLVRINAPIRMAVSDLEAAVVPGLKAVMLPKVESAGQLFILSDLVSELEAERGLEPGRINFVVMIESPAALLRAEEIALASARTVALVLGSEDYAAEAGLVPTPETLLAPKLQLLTVAKACRLLALGLLDTVAAIDAAGSDLARRSAEHGFDGATCVHPKTVAVLNSAFRPTADEVRQAERVRAAMRDALARGHGAALLDGRMVDKPLLRRADALLERHRRAAAAIGLDG